MSTQDSKVVIIVEEDEQKITPSVPNRKKRKFEHLAEDHLSHSYSAAVEMQINNEDSCKRARLQLMFSETTTSSICDKVAKQDEKWKDLEVVRTPGPHNISLLQLYWLEIPVDIRRLYLSYNVKKLFHLVQSLMAYNDRTNKKLLPNHQIFLNLVIARYHMLLSIQQTDSSDEYSLLKPVEDRKWKESAARFTEFIKFCEHYRVNFDKFSPSDKSVLVCANPANGDFISYFERRKDIAEVLSSVPIVRYKVSCFDNIDCSEAAIEHTYRSHNVAGFYWQKLRAINPKDYRLRAETKRCRPQKPITQLPPPPQYHEVVGQEIQAGRPQYVPVASPPSYVVRHVVPPPTRIIYEPVPPPPPVYYQMPATEPVYYQVYSYPPASVHQYPVMRRK